MLSSAFAFAILVGSIATTSAQSAAEERRIASLLAQLPECGKTCAEEASQASGCLLSDPNCFCINKKFLAITYTCESKSCSLEEQKAILNLAPSLCANVAGAFPSINPTVNPSAAVAILTSTTIAPTGTATGSADAADPTASILASLPKCAVPCVKAALQSSGCSFTEPVCVCQNPAFLCPVVACEAGACTGAEIDAISSYTIGFCAPSGGRNFHPACGNLTSTPPSSNSSGNGSVAPAPGPSVAPYSGQAGPSLMAGGGGSGILGTVMVLGAGLAGVGVLAWF